jgi:hypothetical protein
MIPHHTRAGQNGTLTSFVSGCIPLSWILLWYYSTLRVTEVRMYEFRHTFRGGGRYGRTGVSDRLTKTDVSTDSSGIYTTSARGTAPQSPYSIGPTGPSWASIRVWRHRDGSISRDSVRVIKALGRPLLSGEPIGWFVLQRWQTLLGTLVEC